MSNRYTTGNSRLGSWSDEEELGLRDEERSWVLNPYRYGVCPECSESPHLFQTVKGFRVACWSSRKGKCCGPWNTPLLRSSADACDHWRMSRLLSEGK